MVCGSGFRTRIVRIVRICLYGLDARCRAAMDSTDLRTVCDWV